MVVKTQPPEGSKGSSRKPRLLQSASRATLVLVNIELAVKKRTGSSDSLT